jgi:hypothetical protein
MLKNLSSFELATSQHGNKCLRYSSSHWANHLTEVSHDDEAVRSILSVLRTFLFSKQHVRAWIEVVRDLSGAPGGASSSINKTARWCSVSSDFLFCAYVSSVILLAQWINMASR